MLQKDLALKESSRIELASRLQMEKILWQQKCRERWLKEGNRNTRYFHYLANHKEELLRLRR